MRRNKRAGADTGVSSGAGPDLVSHTQPPTPGSDRGFGIVFATVFAIIGLFPLPSAGYVRAWALGIGTAFLFLALVRPRLLAPANRLWIRIGMLLNSIVSPIALMIVYCIAVLPTALVLRGLGKDPLHRRRDSQAQSYWIHRVPPGRPDAQMKKQF